MQNNVKLRNSFILILGIGLLQLIAAVDHERCLTPKNENGLCIEITECKQLDKLLRKNNLTEEERSYLGQSQCGYKDKKVWVCCSLLPRYPNCGKGLESRIIGGNITLIDEYPWMALLEYTKPGNKKGHHCGGALINDRYVLTAGHCLKSFPSNWRLTSVRLGEWDTTTNPDCDYDNRGYKDCAPEHIDVDIEEIIPHPQYKDGSNNYENDIGLIRLSKNVKITDFVQPICLPFDEVLKSETFLYQILQIAGWGRTEDSDGSNLKLKANVKVWDFQRCKNKYNHTMNAALQTTQMCAGGEEGVDSCRGDSGGPLVSQQSVNNGAAFFMIGVISFGTNPCGLAGWPAVFTRVGDFMDFIENNIKS